MLTAIPCLAHCCSKCRIAMLLQHVARNMHSFDCRILVANLLCSKPLLLSRLFDVTCKHSYCYNHVIYSSSWFDLAKCLHHFFFSVLELKSPLESARSSPVRHSRMAGEHGSSSSVKPRPSPTNAQLETRPPSPGTVRADFASYFMSGKDQKLEHMFLDFLRR